MTCWQNYKIGGEISQEHYEKLLDMAEGDVDVFEGGETGNHIIVIGNTTEGEFESFIAEHHLDADIITEDPEYLSSATTIIRDGLEVAEYNSNANGDPVFTLVELRQHFEQGLTFGDLETKFTFSKLREIEISE